MLVRVHCFALLLAEPLLCAVWCLLQGVVPARFRSDKQLVSHDIHTSTYNYKYTFSVEIAPVCKVSYKTCSNWPCCSSQCCAAGFQSLRCTSNLYR
jgi:hypothetical protein